VKYSDNITVLRNFYLEKGLAEHFTRDSDYLEKAFENIQFLWQENFRQIDKIKYLMIAEAPLWGSKKKYIYNPETNNSQFFYRSDLGDVLGRNIKNKNEFLKACNEIGLLVIDISPFALNPTDTRINYKQLSLRDYQRLISLTTSSYFDKKIALLQSKKSNDIRVFFRYSRVKQAFQEIICHVLINHTFINQVTDIGDISQNGGGINKQKLKQILQSA
jgi:hypothetical protein